MTGVPIKEVDIDKIARRLAYLWNLRDKDPRIYSQNRLGQEKEDIYCLYPEAVPLARQYLKELEKR